MKCHNIKNLSLCFCAAVTLLLCGPVHGQTDTHDDRLQDRIDFAAKLLNDSSATRQVDESDSDAAQDLRRQAREQYDSAMQARESGDMETAEARLTEAIRLMYAAVSATQQSDAATAKSDRDFRNRRASVDALLDAHGRIAGEKGLDEQSSQLRQLALEELAVADQLFADGQTARARVHLDAVYKLVKSGVVGLRDGDTLVRELRFETVEDEYAYELDRNDTHKMLISVLLEDRLGDERIRNRVTSLTAIADELRGEAERQAEEGRFDEAVETLERSTKELIKAIRGAGVYIPG